jgi:hypothetical protein
MHLRSFGAIAVAAAVAGFAGCGAPENPGTSQQVPAPAMADPGPDPELEQSAGEEANLNMTEFSQFDTNANGVVEQDEWVERAPPGMEFTRLDENGNGNIDRSEFRAAVERTGGDLAEQEVTPRDLDPTGAGSQDGL